MGVMEMLYKLDVAWDAVVVRMNVWFYDNFICLMIIFAAAGILVSIEEVWKPVRRFLGWLNEAMNATNELTFRFCDLCRSNSVEPLPGLKPVGKLYIAHPGTAFQGIDRLSGMLPAEILHGFCVECKRFVQAIFPEGMAEAINSPDEKGKQILKRG